MLLLWSLNLKSPTHLSIKTGILCQCSIKGRASSSVSNYHDQSRYIKLIITIIIIVVVVVIIIIVTIINIIIIFSSVYTFNYYNLLT